MKYNFQLTLENDNDPLVQNIAFRASTLQATKVFYALAFALVFSDCDTLTLYCGEQELYKCSFNHRDQIPTFTKSEV